MTRRMRGTKRAMLLVFLLALGIAPGGASWAEDAKPKPDTPAPPEATGETDAPAAEGAEEPETKPEAPPEPEGPPAPENPLQGEVPLPATAGWNASLILDNDVGVWTVEVFPVFPQYGCPEVVGLDDNGRCHIMVSYSGRWTPVTVIHDKSWLGGLAHGDVDPRIEGAELYTGGKLGNLYQVVPHKNGVADARMIGRTPGFEIHTILAGDLDPRSPGKELLLFTRPGRLYRVSPTGPDGTFETTLLEELDGRYRDAIVIPGGGARIAAVSRNGRLKLLTVAANGPEWTTIYRDSMGKGRLSLRPATAGEPAILYTTHDDGRIVRHRERRAGGWESETIFLGPQGPRGIAAGRFHADPEVETVAVFGYSGKLQLLSRGPGDDAGWRVETLFVDRDKGHWLTSGELDGRNATRELVLSGYGRRIVLLSRPPGHGRPELIEEPEEE